MTKEQGLLNGVTRWAKEGYNATAVAMALGLHRATVSGVAERQEPRIEFGPKRLAKNWHRLLGKEAPVPPNLGPQHELFKRHMEVDPDWTLEQLGALLLVSEDTIMDWWTFWHKQRVIRNKLAAMDFKLSRKWKI